LFVSPSVKPYQASLSEGRGLVVSIILIQQTFSKIHTFCFVFNLRNHEKKKKKSNVCIWSMLCKWENTKWLCAILIFIPVTQQQGTFMLDQWISLLQCENLLCGHWALLN